MNILKIKNGTYTQKMGAAKLVLIALGAFLVVPSAYTNFEFFTNFFSSGGGTSSTGLCAFVAVLVDVSKLVLVSTFFNILFSSLKGELYFDIISFSLACFLTFVSLFLFSKKGLEYSNNIQALKEKTEQKIDIKLEQANKGASTRNKRKLAEANLSLLEKVDEINKANQEKEKDINEIKSRILDNGFFFLFLCELFSIFVCASLSYLAYRKTEEESQGEQKGEDYIKSLKNKYSMAVYRGNNTLAEEHKKELVSLGATIPNVKRKKQAQD